MSILQDILATGLVDPVDMACVLGATHRSVNRWQAEGNGPTRREHIERMLELKAVLDLAVKVMPAPSAAIWLRAPVPALDYGKPLALISDGEFRRVIDGLNALAEGAGR
jgi:uncharacterized protein (DUF2384 family)